MTSLSTHVLDTAHGIPAAGIAVTLMREDVTLYAGVTDAGGRVPALARIVIASGTYRLVFAVADYFRGLGTPLSDPPFIDSVTIAFGLADAGHYHVPLLVSPFAYSTYRGS